MASHSSNIRYEMKEKPINFHTFIIHLTNETAPSAAYHEKKIGTIDWRCAGLCYDNDC